MKNLKLLCLEVILFLEKDLQYKIENFILKGHHLNNQKYYVYIGQTNT
jgi:hypothetical protein